MHQTYKSHDLPEMFAKCQKQVQALHPDFVYRFYTDEDMDHCMRTEFPDYVSAFQALPRMIMKVDMFRYCLMYKYGGVYLDMDYWMVRPFDLLDKEVVLPCNRESADGKPACLGNCIFASRPGHSFWKTLMDTLFTIDRRKIPYTIDATIDTYVLGTGPMFVYAMWKQYVGDDIYVPRRSLFHPITSPESLAKLQDTESYGMHLCAGSWRNGQL